MGVDDEPLIVKSLNEEDSRPRNRRGYLLPTLCDFCPFDALPALILFCIMFLTFGSYWVFDFPGAVQTQLNAWFGPTYSNADNLNLYSIYSWPNTVLALFGGYLIDSVLGVRLGSLMFCGFIMTGQVIFTMGITYKTYLLCLFGRFVFGLGGESLTVAQNTYTVRWFEGKTLALCFGLVVAFARIGSSINFVVTPRLAALGVPLAAWVGAGTCVLSFVACICLALLDRYGSPRAKVNANAESPVQLRDLTRFPVSAWLLWMICGFFYVAVLSFYTVASAILQNVGHKYSPETATLFLSIPNFVSIVFSPLFGALVDRVGRALTFIMIASVMLACGHVGFLANAMEWVQLSPILLMLWVGLSYSLGAASIWPILGLVVEDRILSTGYGMMTALQNLFLAVFPMLIGALQDKKGIAGTKLQYTLPLMIFIGTSGIAFLLAFILLGIDKAKHNGVMNSSASQREEIKRKAAELADKI